MKIELENYGTGWFSAALGMTEKDVDMLIENLQALKAKRFGHFVVVYSNSDYAKSGLENIEFYLSGKEDKDNATILSLNIKPNR